MKSNGSCFSLIMYKFLFTIYFSLSDQHELIIKTVYGGRLIYDESIKIAATDSILDSGTGTG